MIRKGIMNFFEDIKTVKLEVTGGWAIATITVWLWLISSFILDIITKVIKLFK